MDINFNYTNHAFSEEDSLRRLIKCLKAARSKLTPILDDIIMSAFDSINNDKKKLIGTYTLSSAQYNDIIWATQIFDDIEFERRAKQRNYKLPNSEVIVNNVSVSKMLALKDNAIIIDEATILELVNLYENMGVVIHRLINESVKVNADPTSRDKLGSHSIESQKTFEKSLSKVHESETNEPEANETYEEMDKDESPASKSISSALLDSKEETDKNDSPTSKSTLSVLLNGNNEPKRQASSKRRISYEDSGSGTEPKIYIKIQCFSDWSDDDRTKDGKEIPCAKNCTSRCHLKLDGDPVMLKVNQTSEDGAVYCINTGEDNSDIKIVIKQCPECKSTVIGSSTKIEDSLMGESHESITLHGKQGDETQMAFSSEDDSICHCADKSTICISISKVRCDEGTPPCSCDELQKRSVSKNESVDSQPKMDVVIDTESVDRSTVEVIPAATTTTDDERETPPSSDVAIKREPEMPLTRRRICSSMEFDVTTEHTKLRERGIQHPNPHIVVELKKLGVDQLLRACRPAKCCRKAILNERQRTALPYCVSLNSLPLMNDDIQVIKQSIDMSVRKIKNSMDLTQAQKDKLAFYVSLGRDDFRPNINFPWVIPVFDMHLDTSTRNTVPDRFFVLEKMAIPKQVQSVAKLTGILRNDVKEDRRFILTKAPGELEIRDSKYKTSEKHKSEKKKVRFMLEGDYSDQGFYMKMLKRHQEGNIYKRKNTWTNITDDDWKFIFTQEHEKLDLDCVDFLPDQTKISKGHKRSTSKGYKNQEKVARDVNFSYAAKTSPAKEPLDNGDCACSLTKIFGNYLENVDLKGKKYTYEISKEKHLVNSKSMPNFWNHISEELYYSSKSLTFFVKRTRSLETMEKEMQIFKITQSEAERWKFISSKLWNCKKKTSKRTMAYYVGLINGDLVWSNTLPLKPMNYDTYYNYINRKVSDQSHSNDIPVDETMVARRVTPAEASLMRSLTPGNGAFQSSRRNTLSELDEQTVNHLEAMRIPPSPTSSQGPRLPPEFASFSMGPESTDEPWAPLVASETSLPAIVETSMRTSDVKLVESGPSTEKKTAATQEMESIDEAEMVKRKERKVSKGTEDELTKSEKAKVSINTEEYDDGEETKVTITEEKKKNRDITIAIKKTKDGSIRVEGTAPKPCNKEICEIYKNKHLVPDKPNDENKPEYEDDDDDRRFMITATDKVEIYINKQKINVLNSKKKKHKKKDEKEK